jgi:hypothetical protein
VNDLALLQTYRGMVCKGQEATRLYRAATGELIRAYARFDHHEDQCYARAEVLTPARTWTLLLEDLPDRWHDVVRMKWAADRLDALDTIATALAVSANSLLTRITPARGACE